MGKDVTVDPPTSRLRVVGISKRYGGITALKDINFEIQPGEVHALVGENGAGKSTLVKIITGLESADAGSCYLDENLVKFAKRGEITIADGETVNVPNVGERAFYQTDGGLMTDLDMMVFFRVGHETFETSIPMGSD